MAHADVYQGGITLFLSAILVFYKEHLPVNAA
jgi:hypothetical protein